MSSETISTDSIPQAFKTDRTIVPFISRSNELESYDPIISYFCKLYVLEYILNNKLHTKGAECEAFTIKLLDITESTKKSVDDESLHRVLNDKQLSLNAVFSFGFKVFNTGLESVSKYDGNKISLAQKLKAAVQFLSLLSIFTENDDGSSVDFGKITGGKCPNVDEFKSFVRDKIKIAKYQLSRLMKNEIAIEAPSAQSDKDLEDELDRELQNLESSGDVNGEEDANAASLDLPSAPQTVDHDGDHDMDDAANPEFSLPQAPKFIDDEKGAENNDNHPDLPAAPHFLPDSDDEKDDQGSVSLPGAPKFLPDDDDSLSHINKNSSIHVFPPGTSRKASFSSTKSTNSTVLPKNSPPADSSVDTTRKPSAETRRSPHQHITRENVHQIIDKTEHITKIQKHAKFAVSALNYEDFKTAEDELVRGLELLRSIKDA